MSEEVRSDAVTVADDARSLDVVGAPVVPSLTLLSSELMARKGRCDIEEY